MHDNPTRRVATGAASRENDSGTYRAAASRRGAFDLEDGDLAEAANEYVIQTGCCSPLDSLREAEFLKRVLCGCCYNRELAERSRADEEAQRQVQKVPTITSEFGRGVALYFRYVQYLTFVNFVLSCFALLLYAIAELSGDGLQIPDQSDATWLSQFFLSGFPQEARAAWTVMSTFCMIVAVGAAPLYRWIGEAYGARWRGADRVEERAGESDIKPENVAFTDQQRRNRLMLTMTCTILLIFVQAVVMYYLYLALSKQSDAYAALALSMLISGLNVAWKFIVRFLTSLELHRTVTSEVSWDVGKIVLVKTANLLTLYGAIHLTLDRNIEVDCPAEEAQCRCPLDAQGWQFFFLLAVEILGVTTFELVFPVLSRFGRNMMGISGHQADEPFDLVEEYVEVVYRQLVTYLAVLVFPGAAILSFVGMIVEYWCDKAKLMCSQKPLVKAEPMNAALLMWMHVLIALAAIVSFPNGAIFIFSLTDLRDKNCLIHPSA